MRGKLAAIRRKLRPQTSAKSEIDPRPASNLYECSACRAMVINPRGDRCPECPRGTLTRR